MKYYLFCSILILLLLVVLTRYWIRDPALSLFIPSYTQLSTTEKLVVLSFDDGPQLPCTPALLNLLAKYEVRANFFLLGNQIAAHPELAKRLWQAGHELGNHSYQHDKMIFKSQQFIENDLLKTDQLLASIGAPVSALYRPPYGYSFLQLPLVLQKHRKQLWTWTINPPAQYQLPGNAEKITQQILSEIHPGAIILLHDGGRFADQATLLSVVETVIIDLKQRGYRFVTISEGLR
ncbi:MAG: polysaccharide deacetylase family protein [Saprospiraceae bacterium]